MEQLRYTLALLRNGSDLLMINRRKSPWKGCWNGVGGKLECGESPRDCVIREIREETGLVTQTPVYRGIVSWNAQSKAVDGMYVFAAELPDDARFAVPRATREGILDWKPIDWVLSLDNYGAVPSLRYFLPSALNFAEVPANFHLDFDGHAIIHAERRPLPGAFCQ